MAGPLPVLFGATTGTAPYAPILKQAWFGFNPPFRQSTSSRVSSTNHSCPSRFWSALHTWIKLELWIMIYKLVGAPIIYFPRWQGGPASIFLGRMWASDWSEKYVKGRGGGKAGPTRPIPISTKHLCKFFPVWQRWTYDVVAGARTCTTLVGLSLNFTKKCEYWINLALLLYRDLDTGYPSSQSRIFKFKWPHDQLHSVSTGVESAIDEFIVSKLFAPWLLFITSNIYNKIPLVLFSLTAFNMLQLTAAFLLYRKTVHKLQGLSNHLIRVASVSARVLRERCYAGYTNHLEKF